MRTPSPPIDPAADAAALLRRIGFATLVVLVPSASLVARRATVVLVPIGVALLVIAALLDGTNPGVVERLKRTSASRPGIASLVLIGWAALSIIWTPFPDTAGEKIVNIVGTILIALAGIGSLPERMRSSNLYLIPIGLGLAAVLATALGVTEVYSDAAADEEGSSLERGLVILVVAIWPGLAWLQSRARHSSVVLLAMLSIAAVVAGLLKAPATGLAVGAFVYGIALVRPQLAIRVVSVAIVGALVLAPLFPLVLEPVLEALQGPLYPASASLRTWADTTTAEPLKLITGNGLDTSLRARFAGLLPVEAPQTLPFEVWYELGIVGALAGAVALYFAIRAVGNIHAALLPGALAAFAAAFALAGVGAASAQAWWLTTLGTVVLTFVAVQRGQFRTSRPKAKFFGPRAAST